MSEYQKKLKSKMHEYVKLVYQVTRQFPREEQFGVTSQLRRAALSIILNYIEGYARFKSKTKLQFFEIAYGSLKESKYIVYFSYTERYMTEVKHTTLNLLAEEIGKMLWSEMQKIR